VIAAFVTLTGLRTAETELTRGLMVIKAPKFMIVMAAIVSLTIAKVEESSAAPITVGANMVMASAATKVQYRTYFDDYYGPYTYRPAYQYRGYTYWYPNYGIWAYPRDYYYYNWW
jgi:hypothetical protein